MRCTGYLPGIAWMLAAATLGSGHATAMMGFDGPPPCETEECFAKAVSSCKKDVSYMPGSAAGSKVQYIIEGNTDDGRCQLGMVYMLHPDSEWTYKPLHFVVNPEDGAIGAQLKESVSRCLEGRADSSLQCAGPLLDLSGS